MAKFTDNDKSFGPLTYGRTSWRPWRMMLESHGGDEGNPYNALTGYALGWAFRLWLPRIVQPQRRKVQAVYWDAATVERMGQDWYWNEEPREYGFSLSDGFFQFSYGIQPGDSTRDQHWSCFLPWTQWRFIRFSLYQPDGTHFYTELESERPRSIDGYKSQMEAESKVGKVFFKIRDFDGEEIVATIHVQEREWRFGTRWCSWLGWLRKPKIVRSLDIRFSSEVGPEKGSWKGGTIGHGIDMLMNETPEQAFRRYCKIEHRSKYRNYKIEFLGIV